MTTIATAHADSTAPPSAFFTEWADMASWPEWNADTEWVRLDGPFAAGSTGVLKPRGGPRVKFVIQTLVPDREFVDVSLLLGARLSFAHLVRANDDGSSAVDVTITISGPLSRLWAAIMGKGFRKSAQPDLERLVARVTAPVAGTLDERADPVHR